MGQETETTTETTTAETLELELGGLFDDIAAAARRHGVIVHISVGPVEAYLGGDDDQADDEGEVDQ